MTKAEKNAYNAGQLDLLRELHNQTANARLEDIFDTLFWFKENKLKALNKTSKDLETRRCGYCWSSTEDLKLCQLRSHPRDKRWQHPTWLCKNCRLYLTGLLFRYAKET
jgi:hypothetical protein